MLVMELKVAMRIVKYVKRNWIVFDIELFKEGKRTATKVRYDFKIGVLKVFNDIYYRMLSWIDRSGSNRKGCCLYSKNVARLSYKES